MLKALSAEADNLIKIRLGLLHHLTQKIGIIKSLIHL